MNESPETELQNDKAVRRRLFALFKPYRGLLTVALIGTLFFGLTNSIVALVIAAMMELFAGATSAVLNGQPLVLHLHRAISGIQLYDVNLNGAAEARGFLFILAAATVVLILSKDVIFLIKEYILWKVSNGMLTSLKGSLFDRIVRLPMSYYDRERSGDMISRVTYDVTQLEGAIRAGINVGKSILYTVIYVGMMFLMDWSLTLVALAIFPLSAVIIKSFSWRIRRAARNLSENVADYTSFLAEASSGARAIKAFGQEERQAFSFREKLKENYRWAMKGAKYAAINSPAQEAISSIGTAALVVYCGLRMLAGGMTVGDLSGFLVLVSAAYKPIKDLGEVTGTLQKAIASGRRIFQLMDEPDEAEVIGSGTVKPDVTGKIEFDYVRFAYRGEKAVLNGLNLKIEPGKMTALVGPSGSGKSTIISLIPRFYPVNGGKITLDGVDISRFDLAYLRQQIAYVPQESILFSGTIEDNIRFGNPAALPKDVIEAARAAYVLEFAVQLPNGLQSEVGERGVQLSGGQRQRISIARAILRDPKILLLDEATSALDTDSERMVQEALNSLRENRTTVVIAHRLSTIQNADCIAVIVEGKVAEIGTHKELYLAGGQYRRLCDMQVGGQ